MSEPSSGASIDRRKQRLRSSLRAALGTITLDTRRCAGAALAETLLADARVVAAPQIGLYAATSHELPTRDAYMALRRLPATLCFPRVDADGLAFVPICDWSELEPGRFDILAPREGLVGVELQARDVVLVPGLGFDRAGNRLGKGGGHYDRAFSAAGASAWRIGVAFCEQIVPEVPCDSHDRRMDAIVTPEGLEWLGSRG